MAKATSTLDLSGFVRPKKCVLARWLASELDFDDLTTLEVAWDSHLSAHAIHKWLEDRGNPYTEQTTWRHRAGRCSCWPRRESSKEAA